MKNHDEMYESLLSRYNDYQIKKKKKISMIRRTISFAACFAVIFSGYRIWSDIPRIQQPPVIEDSTTNVIEPETQKNTTQTTTVLQTSGQNHNTSTKVKDDYSFFTVTTNPPKTDTDTGMHNNSVTTAVYETEKIPQSTIESTTITLTESPVTTFLPVTTVPETTQPVILTTEMWVADEVVENGFNYYGKITEIEKDYSYYPELDGCFFGCKKVWLNSRKNMYYAEKKEKDNLAVYISAGNFSTSDVKTATEKFINNNNIDSCEVYVYYDSDSENIIVIVYLYDMDEYENIEKSIRITEFLNENFDVLEAKGDFDKKTLIDGFVMLDSFQILSKDDKYNMINRKDIPDEYADEVNKGLAEMGLKSYYDAESKRIIYSDDENNIADISKVCRYMSENYNAFCDAVELQSPSYTVSKEISFTKKVIEYNASDDSVN